MVNAGVIAVLVSLSALSAAQDGEKPPFTVAGNDNLFKPVVALETWVTYSMDEKKGTTEYANRPDVSFRRFRFGGSGSPYSWLGYDFQLYVDRLGEDDYASTKGSYGGIGIWNAYITAKLLKNSELLNLHAGYYWAAISREFNTSPWAVGSFDKTRSNWYMRSFVTGTGSGIESGIGLGGLKNFGNFGLSYRVGVYEPQAYNNSSFADRLYTGRVMFSIGDPEQTSYKYMLTGNQWRKRKGVTLGLGASTQSDGKLTDTTFFDHSIAFGADILADYEGLRIEGEYFMFTRSAGVDNFNGYQWHVRAGYSFTAGKGYLEPSVSYDKYEGKGERSLFKYIGDDNTLDIGLNWYMNKDKLKLAFHYVIQDGSVSSNIGDYLGLSFQVRI